MIGFFVCVSVCPLDPICHCNEEIDVGLDADSKISLTLGSGLVSQVPGILQNFPSLSTVSSLISSRDISFRWNLPSPPKKKSFKWKWFFVSSCKEQFIKKETACQLVRWMEVAQLEVAWLLPLLEEQSEHKSVADNASFASSSHS